MGESGRRGLAGTDLLDSARHKLRIARYHGETLIAVLAQGPPDEPEEPLRIALEAHLEGLAYAGTAAAEKTLRSVDPEQCRSEMSIENMIRTLRGTQETVATFAADFESWWVGRNRGTRFGQKARDLRNDAAHSFYEKSPGSGNWLMVVRGAEPVFLSEFATDYITELDELSALMDGAAAVVAVSDA